MKQSAPLIFLLLLPGCRAMHWAESHFEQGTPIEGAKSVRDLVASYVRSANIYHEFDTVGLFDVLMLTPAVRQAYVDIYAAKYKLSPEEKEKKAQEQRKEAEHTLSFIVLAYMPDNTMPIGDDNSLWSIVLKGANKWVAPRSSKSYELEPEYAYFLKNKVSKHKYVYLVKFDVAEMQNVELVLAMHDRQTTLRWPGNCFDKNNLPGPRGENC